MAICPAVPPKLIQPSLNQKRNASLNFGRLAGGRFNIAKGTKKALIAQKIEQLDHRNYSILVHSIRNVCCFATQNHFP